jgi:hypothetical protein
VTRLPVSARLMARLREEMAAHGVELPESARCVRQYLNDGDRCNGGWLWTVVADESVPDIGSQWTMREVLTAPVWYVNREGDGACRGQWYVDLA